MEPEQHYTGYIPSPGEKWRRWELVPLVGQDVLPSDKHYRKRQTLRLFREVELNTSFTIDYLHLQNVRREKMYNENQVDDYQRQLLRDILNAAGTAHLPYTTFDDKKNRRLVIEQRLSVADLLPPRTQPATVIASATGSVSTIMGRLFRLHEAASRLPSSDEG